MHFLCDYIAAKFKLTKMYIEKNQIKPCLTLHLPRNVQIIIEFSEVLHSTYYRNNILITVLVNA